ncbi:MAG: PHB depolymerase family esterase [Tahibacter sp.]
MTAFSTTMRNAFRLTRRGDLRAATALIREALQPTANSNVAPIDVEFSVVSDHVSPHANAQPAPVGPHRVAAFLPAPADASDVQPDFDAPGRTIPASAGHFLAGRFSNKAGSRAYKLWIPSHAPGPAARKPLIVMLHGCTQDADDFATGTRMNQHAERIGAYVLYPIQTGTANAQRCWRWFQATDQKRDSGEPSIIAEMTRKVMHEYPIDPRRVYVAGLSAGGAMAAILGETYPDVFAAIGVHSGLAYGAAHDVPSAFAAMAGRPSGNAGASLPPALLGQTPAAAIVFHGDRDSTVVAANADALVEQLAARHSAVRRGSAAQAENGQNYTCSRLYKANGAVAVEQWTLHGRGHAWSGGDPRGSYTDSAGPDASARMLEFFLQHEMQPR